MSSVAVSASGMISAPSRQRHGGSSTTFQSKRTSSGVDDFSGGLDKSKNESTSVGSKTSRGSSSAIEHAGVSSADSASMAASVQTSGSVRSRNILAKLRDRREAFMRGDQGSIASHKEPTRAPTSGSQKQEPVTRSSSEVSGSARSSSPTLNGTPNGTSHSTTALNAPAAPVYHRAVPNGKVAAPTNAAPSVLKIPSVLELNQKEKEMDAYVGFASMPDQVYRKAVKRGFDFTIMVAGASGLGKSTFTNSLFLAEVYNAEHPGPSKRPTKTVQVDTTSVLLNEGGVNLRLQIVDTPGFGDAVDNSGCWKPLVEYINSQFDNYLNAETKVIRTLQLPDTRVHCCIYFIAPSGHGLSALDIEVMRHLHDKVNIIPVLAKADSLTAEELVEFKATVLQDIARHNINIYDFPVIEEDESSGEQLLLKKRVPFAVVGSDYIIDGGDRRVRGRKYPWGTVEVENLAHNDFVAMRNMIIRTHLQDLIDVTNSVHYENFRYGRLAPTGGSDGQANVRNSMLSKDPLTQMEEEQREHEQHIRKLKEDMENVFETKVKEKMAKLKESEAELALHKQQMKEDLVRERRELEQARERFDMDRQSWEEDFVRHGGKLQTLEMNGSREDIKDSKTNISGEKKKKKGIF